LRRDKFIAAALQRAAATDGRTAQLLTRFLIRADKVYLALKLAPARQSENQGAQSKAEACGRI